MAANPRAELTTYRHSTEHTRLATEINGWTRAGSRCRCWHAASNRKNIRTLKAPCEPSDPDSAIGIGIGIAPLGSYPLSFVFFFSLVRSLMCPVDAVEPTARKLFKASRPPVNVRASDS